MSISRYHTVGAVARDLRALKELDERLEAAGVPPGSLLVLGDFMRALGPVAQDRAVSRGSMISSTSSA